MSRAALLTLENATPAAMKLAMSPEAYAATIFRMRRWNRVHAVIRAALTECDVVPTRGDDIDAAADAGHGGHVMAEI